MHPDLRLELQFINVAINVQNSSKIWNTKLTLDLGSQTCTVMHPFLYTSQACF